MKGLYHDFPELMSEIDAAATQWLAEAEKIRYAEAIPAVSNRRMNWYLGPQEGDEFWPALQKHLLHEKQWDDLTVQSIDKASTRVVSELDYPNLTEFKTKGLVLGYVQSGKTANFTAVMNKAADAGFRLFIVLSGMTNSLREQTQIRLEEEVIRLNPKRWVPLTTRHSDFNGQMPNLSAMLSTDQPHLAVVKKNKSRLEKLIKMIRETEKSVLRQAPVLIIDDECDQASVDASGDPEKDPTTINRLIRELLEALPKASYVGYTATPYANVLIDPALDDLYPRDFIVALPQPEGYFGAERLFGRGLLETDPDGPTFDGHNLIRYIDEEEIESLRPRNAKSREEFEFDVTPSMRRAVLYYLLAAAARTARGQGDKHVTMLVHTSQYVQTHNDAKGPIVDVLEQTARLLRENDQTLIGELQVIWEEEQEQVPPASFSGCPHTTFADLSPHLLECAEKTQVIVENSQADERIDYTSGARKYIVVGGNVLARGLTLEGLVVSFFLRTSKQYDTLMQMGRWFGYRPGYADLPRVWMTPDMAGFFRDMATVEAEMREDVKVYSERKLTPADLAPRIRRHPALRITSSNKMTAAQTVDTSYGGRHPQATKYYVCDAEWLGGNWKAGAGLVEGAAAAGKGEDHKSNGSRIYRDVPASAVVQFLKSYQFHEGHADLQAGLLQRYIEQQMAKGHLRRWNVAVVSRPSAPQMEQPLGPLERRPGVVRSRLKEPMEGTADIKALMSTSDMVLDLKGDHSASSWRDAHDLRARAGANPLLLLYPICKDSKPTPAHQETREPLGATADVLGVGFALPESEDEAGPGYVSVQKHSDANNHTAHSEER